jgi:hypothetical protein
MEWTGSLQLKQRAKKRIRRNTHKLDSSNGTINMNGNYANGEKNSNHKNEKESDTKNRVKGKYNMEYQAKIQSSEILINQKETA